MKHLKLSQFAGSNFHYVKHTLDYFLDSMNRLEIPTVELYLTYPHFSVEDASPACAAALSRRLRDRGISVCCATYEQCSYPVNIATEDDAVRMRSLHTLARVFAIARDIGSPYVQVLGGRGSYDLPDEDAWKRAAESLSWLSEKAQACQVTMVIEEASRHVTNTVYTTPLTRKMLDEVGSPYFRAMLDNCATATAGEDFRECIRILGDDFCHMHFADGNPGGHYIPGEGWLPINDVLSAVDDAGYNGAITFELYNKAYEFDPELYMKKCFEYIRGIL